MTVQLEIHVEKGRLQTVQYALHILKQLFKYDEDENNIEYSGDAIKYICIPAFKVVIRGSKGLIFVDADLLFTDVHTNTDRDFRETAYIIAYGFFMNRIFAKTRFEKPIFNEPWQL